MSKLVPPPDSPGDLVVVSGTVKEARPNALFAVELPRGRRVLCRIAGTVEMRAVRINPGDRVVVELSRYDPNRGSITSRER